MTDQELTPIPCGTCGRDIQTTKQLIECRRHYVEDLRLAKADLDRRTAQVGLLLETEGNLVAQRDELKTENERLAARVAELEKFDIRVVRITKP